jgi:hypothetical protein
LYGGKEGKNKYVYSTKSLMPLRYEHSPYVSGSPSTTKSLSKLEKPWRKNMNANNNKFIEHGENKKFINNLHKEVAIN